MALKKLVHMMLVVLAMMVVTSVMVVILKIAMNYLVNSTIVALGMTWG